MLGMFLFSDSTSGGNGTGGNSSIWLLLVVVVLFVGLMAWSSWSNKKRQKKAQEINDKMKPGDKVMSIGGIMGEIVEIREDSFLIKSGETLIELTRQAVNSMENFAPTQSAQPPVQNAAEEQKSQSPSSEENQTDASTDEGKSETEPEVQSEPAPGEGEVGH